MSDELIIEQPQSGTWLNPAKRNGHLIAFLDCSEKEKRPDKLSGKDKEVASFRFVDLDEECDLISGLDNHPGITNKLSVGNPAVVLGRIGCAATQFANDAFVLQEHTPDDARRLQEWHAAWREGRTVKPAAKPTHSPAPAPAAPPASAGTGSAAPDLAAILGSLDADTLALLQKGMAQKSG